MSTLAPPIENLAAHLAIFPEWNLNDGEIRAFRLSCVTDKPVTLEIDVHLSGEWRRPNLDSTPRHEYRTTLRFNDVKDLELENLSRQNVSGELIITNEELGRRRVVHEPLAGMWFTLTCDSIEVVDVLPADDALSV